MRPKSLLLLTLALGCGLVASIGISQVLDRKAGLGRSTTETEAIYIAKLDINLGDALTEEVLKLEEWPKDKIPAGAIRELDELVGRRPRTKVYQGEPILEMKLVAPDARDNPADQVPPGFRVVSVRVDAHTGAAGLLRPGDRVDVQLFVKKDSRTGISKTMAKTILKEVRVFAVEQDFRREADEDEASPPRTVSLVVSPEQADKLTLATRLGEINLVMRNPDDRGNIKSDGANVDDLFIAEKVDREQERKGGDGSSPLAGGLVSFLKQMSQTAAAQPSLPAVAEMASAGPWTMLILEGSDLREVQVREDGLPLDPFAAAAAARGSSGYLPPAGQNTNTIPSDLDSDSSASDSEGDSPSENDALDFGLDTKTSDGDEPDIIPFLNEEESSD
jgi:pilus assembly protein CpaB